MKAADAIIQCVKQENVHTVFGYPGGAVLPLYEALRNSDMRHILVRQEQAAVHSASGFARATGTVGVCIGTSGPGATNLITGIATAYMDSIPLVVLTGQVRSNMIGRDVFQEVDITGATEPFTKHSYLIKEAKEIPRIMKEAFHIAGTGRPGPVLVDIPMDLQEEHIVFDYPETVQIRGYKPTVKGHAGQIKRALKRLKSSKRPLIVAGGGISLAKSEKELKDFVEKAKIPVVHTLMGVGCLPTEHPYYMGMIGSHGFPFANRAVAQADVVVFIGARIGDRATGGAEVFAKHADIIHIDIDPAEIGKNLGVLIPVVGDCKHILQCLYEGIENLDTEEWIKDLNAWKEQGKQTFEMGAMVNPKYAIQLLSEIVDEEAILVADVGQNQMWAARNFCIKGERKYLTSGGLGTMGYSLPAAVGVKMGVPHRQVVAVMGDGSFQMSMYELGTIKTHKLPLVILLFNNQRLGMVRELQDRTYGNRYGVFLEHNPDFMKLAEAYGMKGRRITRNEDLQAAFEEALQAQEPYLLECLVDSEESTL